MAQLNVTLNEEEILLLMQTDRTDAFRKILENSLNQFLKAESTEQLNAERYERTEGRTDSRNGSYTRTLTTRLGTITLAVPRHRNVPFKSLVFDNYSTSEASLITTMAEMVVNGVATRRVGKVMETLCGRNFSKSTVSETCKELDKSVYEFKNKSLNVDYPFVDLDATYFSVRENHKVISKSLYIAYATNEKGVRDIIGFHVYPAETKAYWTEFLFWLKSKGLRGVRMFTSDAHEGIRYAMTTVFPTVPWQRCQYHFLKNIVEQVPKSYQKGISSELAGMFNCSTIEDAIKKRDRIINDYSDIAEKAMDCLDRGFDSAMTVMLLPEELRVTFRTSNHLERLNKELKRRSKAIGIFPNVESLTRLMGAVMLERNEVIQQRVHPLFTKATYTKLLGLENELKKVAEEQQGMMVA